MKTLIIYGTRYGATAGTSEKISEILHDEGFEVKVVNAKEEKINNISKYDLIIVGSGLQIGKWTSEAENVLKKFQNELKQKKLAIFISSMKTVSEREGKNEDVEKTRQTALNDKIAKYNLTPISVGLFGGVLDFNKMNFLTRKTFGFIKPQLEKDGFEQTSPDVYELRDWQEITNWARELAQKVK